MNQLTHKQEKFCQEYIKHGVAITAYKSAYDAQNMGDNSIYVTASRLLDKPNIALRIDELRHLQLKASQVTIDKVVAEYNKIAFADTSQAYYPDGTIKPFDEMPEDVRAAIVGFDLHETQIGDEHYSRVKKLKFVDKKGALADLGKFLGMFVTEVKHSGTISLAQLVDDSYKSDKGTTTSSNEL